MKLRELIKWAHRSELNQAVQDVKDAEWQEIEEFDAIVDEATSVLMTAISVDDTFNGYSENDIRNEVEDLICCGFHGL